MGESGRKNRFKSVAAKGIIFLVVNVNVNYRRAVPVGETLLVSTDVSEIGSRSVVLKQEILFKNSEQVAADALITFVIADKSGKAVSIEGDMLTEIEKLRTS